MVRPNSRWTGGLRNEKVNTTSRGGPGKPLDEEGEGHQGAVVQLDHPFAGPQGANGQAPTDRLRQNVLAQSDITREVHGHVGGPEHGQRASIPLGQTHAHAVGVYRGMRGHDDDGLRLDHAGLLAETAHRLHRRQDIARAPPAHGGDDDGRMGGDEAADQRSWRYLPSEDQGGSACRNAGTTVPQPYPLHDEAAASITTVSPQEGQRWTRCRAPRGCRHRRSEGPPPARYASALSIAAAGSRATSIMRYAGWKRDTCQGMSGSRASHEGGQPVQFVLTVVHARDEQRGHLDPDAHRHQPPDGIEDRLQPGAHHRAVELVGERLEIDVGRVQVPVDALEALARSCSRW